MFSQDIQPNVTFLAEVIAIGSGCWKNHKAIQYSHILLKIEENKKWPKWPNFKNIWNIKAKFLGKDYVKYKTIKQPCLVMFGRKNEENTKKWPKWPNLICILYIFNTCIFKTGLRTFVFDSACFAFLITMFLFTFNFMNSDSKIIDKIW